MDLYDLDPAERSDPVRLEGLRQERRDRAVVAADMRASVLLEALKSAEANFTGTATILRDLGYRHLAGIQERYAQRARHAIALAEGAQP